MKFMVAVLVTKKSNEAIKKLIGEKSYFEEELGYNEIGNVIIFRTICAVRKLREKWKTHKMKALQEAFI